DPLDLVDLGPPPHGPQRTVVVGQCQVATLREHDVEVQFSGEALVQPERPVVEGDALRSQVVGPEDGGVAPGAAAADVALVENRHVGDAVSGGQVVGGGQAVDAAADDDDVVGTAQVVAPPGPGPIFTGECLPDDPE